MDVVKCVVKNNLNESSPMRVPNNFNIIDFPVSLTLPKKECILHFLY